MIIDTDGHPQGYLVTLTLRWGKSLPVIDMAFANGANVQAIMPPVLRALAQVSIFAFRCRSAPIAATDPGFALVPLSPDPASSAATSPGRTG